MRLDPALHYLDNAATTLVDPAVAEDVLSTLRGVWGNPSSLYAAGAQAQAHIQRARERVAQSLPGARADEIYFTAGGTESNNIALRGAARVRTAWADNIVTTGFEHPSVQNTLRALGRELGWQVVEVPPETDGTLDVQKLAGAVNKRTALVACMAVNNETGAVQDIAALAAAVKAKNSRCAVHVDAVQAWLRIPVDLKKWRGVDTLSLSGHKVHAPKGVGALYLCDNQRQHFAPPYAGGHQERGIRPGTENVAGIHALGLAARHGGGAAGIAARSAAAARLRARLLAGLADIGGITVNSPADGVPEILNFSTGRVNSQTMIEFLGQRQVYVSGGSACDKGEPSHTLLAMGCDGRTVKTALRVSFCADNTPQDVDALLDGLREGLAALRHI